MTQVVFGAGKLQYTDEQQKRIAELIAVGAVGFPLSLKPVDAIVLAEKVRRLRKSRLLRLIAHAIAVDLCRITDKEGL